MATAAGISRVLGKEFRRAEKKKSRIKRIYDWTDGFIVNRGPSSDVALVSWSTGWSTSISREKEKVAEMAAYLEEAGYEVTMMDSERFLRVS